MKNTTIKRYNKWKESAKSGDKFTCEGVAYSQKKMDEMIYGDKTPEVKPEPKPEPKVEETINIDIETQHEDMGQPLDRGDSEEY